MMMNPVDLYFTTLSIVICLVNSAPIINQGIYQEAPVNVTVLDGKELTLQYKVNFPEPEIVYCHWLYRATSSDPWETFMGWNNIANKRENFSNRNRGWLFLSVEPCLKGIFREEARAEHAGIYLMVIRDKDNTEHEQESVVHVVQGSSQHYTVVINEVTYRGDLTGQSPEKHTDEHTEPNGTVMVNVSTTWQGGLTVSQHIGQCDHTHTGCLLNADLDNKTIIVDMQPQVQGAEAIPLTYAVKSSTPVPAAAPAGTTGYIVAIIVLVILLIIVILGGVVYWITVVRVGTARDKATIREQEDRIGRLQNNIKSLTDERNTLRGENQTLTDTLKVTEGERDTLKRDNQTLTDNLKVTEGVRDTLKRDYQTLTDQLRGGPFVFGSVHFLKK